MAKAEGLPPTASVASVGPGIRYIGERCYAYSGVITFTDVVSDALNFTSGSGYIAARAIVSTLDYSGDDVGIVIKLNDIIVVQQRFSTLGNVYLQALPMWDIIIPPFTEVVTTFGNLVDTTPHTANVVLTGRVYDA